MRANFECLYCGYTWDGYLNQYAAPECDRCKDKQIKARELDSTSTDPFGYKEDQKRIKREQELEQAKLFRDQSPTKHRRQDGYTGFD